MPHTVFGAGNIRLNPGGNVEGERRDALLKRGVLQDAIFNSVHFSCIATDERGVIQIFNLGAERMLGFSPADVLNRISPADISDPQELVARAETLSLELSTTITAGFEALIYKASRGIEDIYELTFLRKDGSRFPAIVSVTALRDPADEIIGYLLIGTDNTAGEQAKQQVTELNAGLEERVRQRTSQLHIANKELEAFSYSLSHDLRTPLSAIDGFSDLLSTEVGATASERGKHYLSRIRAGVKYMSQLIDAMLILAHASRTSPCWESADLSGIAQTILAGYHEREPSRQVQWDIQPDMVAEGDPQLLTQVLDNLLGNAWKFSSRNQQARITFERSLGSDGRIVYSVSDNGAGFDMTYAEKLFGTFQRLHSAAEFPGTGIGLATVHRIVTRHGGRVWATSTEGQGATFYFTLGTRVIDDSGLHRPRRP